MININITKPSKKDLDHIKSNYVTVILDGNNRLTSLLFGCNNNFRSIEYLSIRNNFVQKIDFIKNMNNLWYLDIRDNQIQNFDSLSERNTLGFLGVTVGKYTMNEFFKLNKLNIAILKFEGEFNKESLTRLNQFVYHSTNSFLLVNEEIVLNDNQFNLKLIQNMMNKKKINDEDKANAYTLIKQADNRKYYFAALNSERRNTITVEPEDSGNSKVKKLETMIESFKKTINSIVNTKISKFQILPQSLNSEEVGDGIRNNYKTYSINKRPSYRMSIDENFPNIELNDSPEYLQMERRKIVYVYETVNSFKDFLKFPNDNILYHKTDGETITTYNFDIFYTKDMSILVIILEIFILYILGLIPSDLAYKFIKLTMSANHLSISSSELKNILDCDISVIIGFYFHLYDYYKDKVIFNKNSHELKSNLQMNHLIKNVNFIRTSRADNLRLYESKKESSYETRKLFINSIIIRHLKSENNLVEEILQIMQHLHDYIINKKLEVKKQAPLSYQIFQEIRSNMFLCWNNTHNSILFPSSIDRAFNEHITKTLSNELYFLNDHKCLLKNNKDERRRMLTKFVKSKLTGRNYSTCQTEINLKTKSTSPSPKEECSNKTTGINTSTLEGKNVLRLSNRDHINKICTHHKKMSYVNFINLKKKFQKEPNSPKLVSELPSYFITNIKSLHDYSPSNFVLKRRMRKSEIESMSNGSYFDLK